MDALTRDPVMSSHVRARRRRQLPDAGGYPSLFTALSTLPCLYPRSLSVPSPPPRVSLTHLIYYSRSGCFINCLSLRIKPSWTRVGGTRRRALISSIASFLPFPLSPRVLAVRISIHLLLSRSIFTHWSSLTVDRLAPRAVPTRDAISARYVCFFFALSYYFTTDKRAVSVSPPEISRADRRMSEILPFSYTIALINDNNRRML